MAIVDPQRWQTTTHRFQRAHAHRLAGPAGPVRAQDIDVPVLLLHGALEPVAPAADVLTLVRALTALDRPHRVAFFPEAGHSLAIHTSRPAHCTPRSPSTETCSTARSPPEGPTARTSHVPHPRLPAVGPQHRQHLAHPRHRPKRLRTRRTPRRLRRLRACLVDVARVHQRHREQRVVDRPTPHPRRRQRRQGPPCTHPRPIVVAQVVQAVRLLDLQAIERAGAELDRCERGDTPRRGATSTRTQSSGPPRSHRPTRPRRRTRHAPGAPRERAAPEHGPPRGEPDRHATASPAWCPYVSSHRFALPLRARASPTPWRSNRPPPSAPRGLEQPLFLGNPAPAGGSRALPAEQERYPRLRGSRTSTFARSRWRWWAAAIAARFGRSSAW